MQTAPRRRDAVDIQMPTALRRRDAVDISMSTASRRRDAVDISMPTASRRRDAKPHLFYIQSDSCILLTRVFSTISPGIPRDS